MAEDSDKMTVNVNEDSSNHQVPRRQRQYLGKAKRWHKPVRAIVLVAATLILFACETGYYDFDKARTFESYFAEGMSREEVERKLAELGEFHLIDESTFPDGDYALAYRTPGYRQWGANGYVFRFTPDWRLVVVFPVVP